MDSELGKALLLLEAHIICSKLWRAYLSQVSDLLTVVICCFLCWALFTCMRTPNAIPAGWCFAPSIAILGSLHTTSCISLVSGFGFQFSEVTRCTSTAVFISWSCLSADFSAFAISLASLIDRIPPFLKRSFLTQSKFMPSTRASLRNWWWFSAWYLASLTRILSLAIQRGQTTIWCAAPVDI